MANISLRPYTRKEMEERDIDQRIPKVYSVSCSGSYATLNAIVAAYRESDAIMELETNPDVDVSDYIFKDSSGHFKNYTTKELPLLTKENKTGVICWNSYVE
jgi:hypothetical protein